VLSLLLLIAGFLLSVFTAFISFRDKHREYRSNISSARGYRTIFAVAVSAALITLIANLVANEEKRRSTASARKLTDSLIIVNESVKRAEELNLMLLLEQKDSTNQVLSLQQRLIESANALNQANKQIVGLQHSVIRHIADTNNFPRLEIARVGRDPYYHTLTILMNNTGESPLRDVRMKFYDMYSDIIYNRALKRYENLASKDTVLLFEHVTNNEKEIIIGDMPRHSGKNIHYLRMPRMVTGFGYNLNFSWDNGSMHVYFMGTFNPPNDQLTFKLIHLTDGRMRPLPKDLVRFVAFNQDEKGRMIPDKL
jgi:hypothetical protein